MREVKSMHVQISGCAFGEMDGTGTSLVEEWIRLLAPNARGPGSIPCQRTRSHVHAATKSSHATTKEPACCN